MKISTMKYCVATLLFSALAGTVTSCADGQPAYECAAQNHSIYQLRYYRESTNCPADSGYITESLVGGTAGMETYMLFSKDGKGGPTVVLRDSDEQVDRSATKLGLRLDTLLTSVAKQACDNNLLNNCSAPDKDFSCRYCVTVVGDGGPGTTYTLPDGTNGEGTPLPDGGRQGIEKPIDGGVRRISLANNCVPGKKDDVTRTASTTPNSDLNVMLPRYGNNGVCPVIDGGSAISTAVFPEQTCQDLTKLDKVTIETTLSDYKLVASPRILGNLAKAKLTFIETRGTTACTSKYKVVIFNPQIDCSTDLDCSPDAVPSAPKCGDNPDFGDFCLSGSGASVGAGSGITINLFQKYPDGGYDLRNTCDRELKVCIWDADAGSI